MPIGLTDEYASFLLSPPSPALTTENVMLSWKGAVSAKQGHLTSNVQTHLALQLEVRDPFIICTCDVKNWKLISHSSASVIKIVVS